MNKGNNELEIDGVLYKTNFNKKWENREKWQEPNEKLVEAHIPGLIIDIKVKKGDKVKEGQLALTLQAMKMNNKILIPVNGIIKDIYIKEGDRVGKGDKILEIE